MALVDAINGKLYNLQPQSALAPNLGGLLNLRIDPTWPWADAWVRNSANFVGAQIPFTFMENFESGITETATPEYQTVAVLGRGQQYKTYTGTSNRQVELNLIFQVQGLKYTDIESAIVDEVTGPARWIDSLKFPWVDEQGIQHAPPPVILTLGNLLIMRCIVESAPIHWAPGWEIGTFAPHRAEVSVTFTEVDEQLGNYRYSGPSRFQGFDVAAFKASPSLGAGSLSTQSGR